MAASAEIIPFPIAPRPTAFLRAEPVRLMPYEQPNQIVLPGVKAVFLGLPKRGGRD